MKILVCTNSFENVVNGPAKFANLLLQINTLYPQHEVRILTEDIPADKLANMPYVYKVELAYPRFLQVFGQIFRMFTYYNRAREVKKEFSYDILVYINAFTGLWGAIRSDKPTIGMINDDNNLKASISTIASSQRWLKKFIFKRLEKASTRYHQAVISNSDYLTKQLIAAYNIYPQKVYRLYKAVDLKNILYNPVRDFNNPVKILFVKADYMRGGLQVLAEALSILKQFRFTITIIGPHQRFAQHISMLFTNHSHVQTHFLAEQPQAMVYSHLSTHDIFCVPSLQEALGVANIEALAFGIPVVSTKAGGIPEVLDNGNNGWLALPDNATSLANALQECIHNPQERLQKSTAGRKFIEKFSAPYMFKNFLRILEECK